MRLEIYAQQGHVSQNSMVTRTTKGYVDVSWNICATRSRVNGWCTSGCGKVVSITHHVCHPVPLSLSPVPSIKNNRFGRGSHSSLSSPAQYSMSCLTPPWRRERTFSNYPSDRPLPLSSACLLSGFSLSSVLFGPCGIHDVFLIAKRRALNGQ